MSPHLDADAGGPADLRHALVLVDLAESTTAVADFDAPLLPVTDLSAHRGDGVFETVLVDHGRYHNADRHFARFARSAAAMELPAPEESLWKSAFDECVDEFRRRNPGIAEFGVRYVMSRGLDAAPSPHGWVMSAPMAPGYVSQRATGISAGVISAGHPAYIGREAPWLLHGAKTLSYAANMAMGRWAAAHGYEEVLRVTTDGIVLEFPTGNIVIARGRELLTPDPAAGLLHGTTQQGVFDRAAAAGWATAYADLSVADVRTADGVWALSSLRKVVPVKLLDGTALHFDSELDALVRSWGELD